MNVERVKKALEFWKTIDPAKFDISLYMGYDHDGVQIACLLGHLGLALFDGWRYDTALNSPLCGDYGFTPSAARDYFDVDRRTYSAWFYKHGDQTITLDEALTDIEKDLADYEAAKTHG